MRLEIAFARHHADVLVFDLVPALVELADAHQRGLHHVERLEARDNHGLLELLGEELVRLAADDGADMRRSQERVDGDGAEIPYFRTFQNVVDRGGRQHMIAKNGKIRKAFRLGLADGDGGWRRGRLEADGEEHHLAPGFCRAILSASSME